MWVNWWTFSPFPLSSHLQLFVSVRYIKCCGGHGSLAVYAILFDILIITLFDWLTFCSHIINTNHLNFLSMVLVMTAVLSLSKSQCLQEVLNLNYSLRNGIVWWFSGLEFKDLVRLFWECYISSTYGCTHEHTLTINCYKSWHTNITASTLPYPTINIELISLLFYVFLCDFFFIFSYFIFF